jgi:integrase
MAKFFTETTRIIMPSFRSSKKQSEHLVRQKVQLGKLAEGSPVSADEPIRSIATSWKYQGNTERFIDWLHGKKRIFIEDLTEDIAEEYLRFLGKTLSQKTVDGYRQAIKKTFDLDLQYVLSDIPTTLVARAYSDAQIDMLITHADSELKTSIRAAADGGLRAVELLTIARPTDMSEHHRPWVPERFSGRKHDEDFVVKGKGGLKRAIKIKTEIAAEVYQKRLDIPVTVTQRKIRYHRRYTLLGGHSFSLEFSRLSSKVFGWSNGAHGLRHSFAKKRLQSLQKMGFIYQDALLILSQELGHFSITNTLTYLR